MAAASPLSLDLRPLSGYSLLLAISGGLDSVVLLDLLIQADLKPSLAHVNFQLRSQEAEADQRLVEELAEQHQLPLYTKRVDTASQARENGTSIQETARQLRYDYFRQLMQEENIDTLLTGHHLDDDIETSLLYWGRGSGLRGLSGIPQEPHRQRPLLSVPKTALYAYAKERGLRWREDSSNAKTDYLRNTLRHRVIPSLQEAFDHWPAGIRTTLDQLKADRRDLEYMLDEKIKEHRQRTGSLESLDLEKLIKQPYFKALLHHWLPKESSFDLKALATLNPDQSGQQFDQGGWCLRHDRGRLLLWPQEDQNTEPVQISAKQASLTRPLSLSFYKQAYHQDAVVRDESVGQFDLAQLSFPLTLRLWQAGDRFQPLGMEQEKKLSDFFTDLKLSPLEKKRQYVLCSADKVIWVVGRRIDHRFRLSNSTKTIYFARINSL